MPFITGGSVYRRKGTSNWTIKFTVDGQVRRETAGTPDREAALAFLRRRLDEAARSLFIESAERVTFAEMRELLVDMPRVDNARQGFFEEEDLQAILPHLPSHARSLVEFLYLTGWRSGEASQLQWADVDWKRQTILLRTSKSREPRIFPFKYHPRLEDVLRGQRAEVADWEREHACLYPAVFHWRGRPLKKLRRPRGSRQRSDHV